MASRTQQAHAHRRSGVYLLTPSASPSFKKKSNVGKHASNNHRGILRRRHVSTLVRACAAASRVKWRIDASSANVSRLVKRRAPAPSLASKAYSHRFACCGWPASALARLACGTAHIWRGAASSSWHSLGGAWRLGGTWRSSVARKASASSPQRRCIVRGRAITRGRLSLAASIPHHALASTRMAMHSI